MLLVAGCPQVEQDGELPGITPPGTVSGGGSSSGQTPPANPGGSGGGAGGGGAGGVAVPELPAGGLRIVTLGDSLTEGIGDESGAAGGYPRRLLEKVVAGRAGSTILNLGKSGWTSGELIEGQGDLPNQIDAAVAARPDVACLWIGSNDLFRLYEYGPESGTTAELEAEDLANYAANIETLLSRLEQTGAALYVGLLDDQSLRPVIEDRLTLPNTTVAERPQMSQQVTRYNNVLVEAARRHGATVIDFFRTTIFTSIDTLDYDGIHPNAAGYDVIADMWYAAMSPAVAR
jgi:lysophospholipase L1-like esterase